jgi:hypothetical protein
MPATNEPIDPKRLEMMDFWHDHHMSEADRQAYAARLRSYIRLQRALRNALGRNFSLELTDAGTGRGLLGHDKAGVRAKDRRRDA